MSPFLGVQRGRPSRMSRLLRRHRSGAGIDNCPARGSFVQYYGGKGLDASLLLIPVVGFLPASDPRVLGTLKAIEEELLIDGFVARYHTDPQVDGCRSEKASSRRAASGSQTAMPWWGGGPRRARFERLLALRSGLGLLAEEYDPKTGRLIGDYAQALSHIVDQYGL